MKNFTKHILITAISLLFGSLSVAIAADETIEMLNKQGKESMVYSCLLYTSPSPRDRLLSRMPSSA